MPPPKPPRPPHEHPRPPDPPPHHPLPPPHEHRKFRLSSALVSSLLIAIVVTIIFAISLYFLKVKIEVILPTSAPIFVGILTVFYAFLKER